MKKEFEELYQNLQSKNTEEIQVLWEEVKKENKKKNTIFIFVAIIFCIFIFNTVGFSFHSVPLVFMAFVFTYIILTLLFSKNTAKFNQIFKEKIINNLINNFYDEIDYIPKKEMPRNIYDEARYQELYNRYYSDDYFEGKLDGKYFVKMAEIKTVQETTDSDGDTNRVTRFHGLFTKIELNKSINSELVIHQNTLFSGKHKLEMDSQEFEKYFDVTSTNKIIGMQILTPEVMELLVDFLKTTQIQFDISIYNSKMYIRFETGSMFEMSSIKKGAFDKKTLERYYNILSFTYTLPKYIINIIEQTEF